MHLALQRAGGASFNGQHRPAMALGDDVVLQLIGPPAHQLLQAALAFLPLALQLPA